MKSAIHTFTTVELILRESEAVFLKRILKEKQEEPQLKEEEKNIITAFLFALIGVKE